jgi:NitT/TauT family transport system substrate-binding protein
MMKTYGNQGGLRAFTRSLLAVAGFAAVAAPGSAFALDKVSFIADWFPEAEHGCYYQAKADGTYEKAGLDVEIRPGGPSINNAQLLATGAVDFALISSGFQMISYTKDKIPIVSVATLMQRHEQILMAHQSAGLKSLADMKGKPIMISAFSKQGFWAWLVAAFGFTDDQIRPYDFNLAPFLHDKSVIVQGYVTSEPFAAAKAGADPQVFLLADSGYEDVGALIAVRKDWVTTKKDLVQRFVDSTIKGCYSFFNGDPSKAFALIKSQNSEMTDDQMKFTWDSLKKYSIFNSPDTDKLGIGAVTDEKWKSVWDIMVKSKISQEGEDYKAAYVKDFVNKKVGMQ